MPESLSTFPPFPSRPGLVGAATSGREPRRQPCPLPAAFPGKRGRTGAGSRGNLALPRAPSSLALPWGPPRPGGEEKRPPRGGAAGGNSWGQQHLGRWRREHLGRCRRIPRRPQLEGPAAAGLPRAGRESPRRGGEGRRRKRLRGSAGKGSPALSSPPRGGVGVGKGWGGGGVCVPPGHRGVKAGRAGKGV